MLPLLVTPTPIGGAPASIRFSHLPFLWMFSGTSVWPISGVNGTSGAGSPKSLDATVARTCSPSMI
jgi:hypothetical protein